MITKDQLVRTINVMKPGEIDFFLGAGASVNSGIPSGGDLVWYFKRLIYCNENRVSVEKYKDLYLPSTRDMLQAYFDKKGTYPPKYDSGEYSHYFQECYPIAIARQRFIDDQVAYKNPSLGYLCLAELISKDKIKNTKEIYKMLKWASKQKLPVAIRYPRGVDENKNLLADSLYSASAKGIHPITGFERECTLVKYGKKFHPVKKYAENLFQWKFALWVSHI